MYVEMLTTASTLAIRHQRHILPLLRKLRFLLTRGRLSIIVFGPTGVGKSTLGDFLCQGREYAVGRGNYVPSVTVEEYALPGEVFCKVLVPPGEAQNRTYVWSDLFEELSDDRSVGVVNVVAFGYHTFREKGYRETEYYKEGMAQDDFMQAYMDHCRREELKVIRQLTPRICDTPGKLWMITLVTKQDLWWDRRRLVREYYEQGEYGEQIKQIRDEKGAAGFRHEYLSASLIMENFLSGADELLAPTVEGYDQKLQVANNHMLANSILGLVQA